LYLFIRWEKRAETEIGDGRKEEVETQEKICGRACFFCSLLCIIPLKIYASRGENYSTNDRMVFTSICQKESVRTAPAGYGGAKKPCGVPLKIWVRNGRKKPIAPSAAPRVPRALTSRR
jgi:hypothetical protein